jgi:hypothetical protein
VLAFHAWRLHSLAMVPFFVQRLVQPFARRSWRRKLLVENIHREVRWWRSALIYGPARPSAMTLSGPGGVCAIPAHKRKEPALVGPAPVSCLPTGEGRFGLGED